MKLIKHTYIIAEAGVNHNGSMKYAKKLIIGAKKAGANAIKFQNFISENLVTKNTPKAKYQIINTKKKSNQLEMLKNGFDQTGIDIFTKRGGFYHNPILDVTTPWCRHIWEQQIVRIKNR